MRGSLTSPVVGIGASAGGMEACKILLAHLPADVPLALVFVLHPHPNHHSHLAEILAGTTHLPVRQAADGMTIEPGHVYVVPPDSDLELASHALKRIPRNPAVPQMPIDRFLRSLTRACGRRAMGVILSGTGADGALGLEAVKSAGGVTFAQAPSTAKFAAMPQAAIARQCVDFVLPPEAIAAELTRLGRSSIIAEEQCAPAEPFPDGQFDARLAYFLDPDYLESLKTLVYPPIVQNRSPQSAIRVWVPGCATGEEAFSLAISLSEYLEGVGASFPVRIFASDTSLLAIEKARSGRYPESLSAHISAERLNRYFIRAEYGYQIHKVLRDMCVFAPHSLFADPPFSKLDLVSCRNRMLCLSDVGDNLLPLFHYALKPNGILLLGASRGAEFPTLFTSLNHEQQIYVSRETAREPYMFRAGSPGTSSVHTGDGQVESPLEMREEVDVRKEADRLLLSRYNPAGVVVDEELRVLEIRGEANRFLSLPAGKASLNLLKLISDTGLFWNVEKLLHQAKRSGKIARRERIPFGGGGRLEEISVEVVPLYAGRTQAMLIVFETVAAAAHAAAAASSPALPVDRTDRQIAHLQQELEDSRQRFLALIEQQQTLRDESRHTTEEALCNNEELQSLNEELETAKEELQSVNEELTVLNQELMSNNSVLTEARDFALSVIETSAAPLLILDTDLRIKAANPAFYEMFRIFPHQAEGQPLYSVSNRCLDIPDLRDMLQRVLPDQKAIRGFEIDRIFPVIGHRVLIISARQLPGLQQILLGIDDVTERQARADATLQESEQRFRSMADAAPVMIWVSEPDRARTFFNRGWLAFTGRTMEQEVNDGWVEGVYPLDLDCCLDVYSSFFHEHRGFQVEYRLRRADGEYRWLLDHRIPRFEPGGNFVGYIGSCIDVTDLKRNREEHVAKQKLESVGTLAGGIAHDFNNLLGGVLAHAELALVELAEGSSPEEDLRSIRAVAIRGSEIVRQLMIYAGQETEVSELVDVSLLVQEMIELLKVAVSKHAVVESDLGRDLPVVRANPSQLRQVLMNLIINASEAIGDRDGVIRIATRQVTHNRKSTEPVSENLPAGDYLQLEVADTGCGMTPETQARVFDPFFTTRQAGHGLGLSVVHGVVRSLHGAVRIVSALGRGTTFQILLPCAIPSASAEGDTPARAESETLVFPRATVLVVEDEDSLRLPLALTLQRSGLTVIQANDGSSALDLLRTHNNQIDVVLLDITLPGVSSRRLFEEAQLLKPGMPVIVTTAYSRQRAAASLGAPVKHFIRKPYRLDDLLSSIRHALSSAYCADN